MEKLFQLGLRGTDKKTEIIAGLTTFMTMAYVLAVQPAAICGGEAYITDVNGVVITKSAIMITCALVSGLITLLMAFLLSKPIRAYQLGEVYAQNMGVPLRAFRTALILLSSVLSACVTAFAGPISFVGIAVPHLMKSLFKSAEPLCMIPACFLGGGVFCLFCDLIARTAFAPTEVSISSVTAVFGAPIVIYMMIHRKAA